MREINVYGTDGNPLYELVQYDKDVTVCIREKDITQAHPVHFFNKVCESAYVVDSTYEAGTLKAKIPNVLLAKPYLITGYVHKTTDGESRSLYGFRIQIEPRPAPSDYIPGGDQDYLELSAVLDECRDWAKQAGEARRGAGEYAEEAAGSAAAAKSSEGEAEKSAQDAKKSAEAAHKDALAAEKTVTESAEALRQAVEQSAAAASKSAGQAKDWARQAESFTRGSTGIREGEDEDNAREYARQAKEAAEKAAEKAGQIAGGNFIGNEEKGIPGGVATLDETGKIHPDQIREITKEEVIRALGFTPEPVQTAIEYTMAAASWKGNAFPYTYEIEIPGLTAAQHVYVGGGMGLTLEQIRAFSGARITAKAQEAGRIILQAVSKPGSDLPVVIGVGGEAA